MAVKQVVGESGLSRALADAGGKLVIVDFYAEWCGPCKMFAPEYERMSTEYPDVLFLKVCEKDSSDAMMARGIRAFPTFHLYIKSSKVGEMSGASGRDLKALIEKHKGSAAAPAFAGSGMTLGSSGGAKRPEDVREARLRALGAAGGGPSRAPAPAPAPSSAPKAVSIDKSSLASLEDMGFGQVRAAKALLVVGGKNIEAAMEWLGEHQDEAGVDEPTEEVTAALRQAASFKQPSPTGGAAGAAPAPASSSAMDVDSQGDAPAPESAMTKEEMEEAQADADAEAGAGAADGSGAPPRKLTLEEVQARVKAIRAAKAAKAKDEARAREIARREDGKKSNEAAEAIKAQQRQFEIDKIRREKEAAEKEKLRLQIEVLKDKAERESKQHGKVSDETLAKLKALQEGKPMPAAANPGEVVKKAIAAMSMQKRDAVGKTAAETLLKLLGNAAANPGEDKFRELKYSMKVVKERLLVAPPSITLLTTVGFVKEDGADGPVLRMGKEHASSDAGQAVMKDALAQLQAALDAKAFD